MSKLLNLREIGRLVNELQSEATAPNRRGNGQWSRSKRRETSIIRNAECTKHIEELQIKAIERKHSEEKKKAKIGRIASEKLKKADHVVMNLIGHYLKD